MPEPSPELDSPEPTAATEAVSFDAELDVSVGETTAVFVGVVAVVLPVGGVLAEDVVLAVPVGVPVPVAVEDGAALVGGVVDVVAQLTSVNTFVSSVTAPLRASARLRPWLPCSR